VTGLFGYLEIFMISRQSAEGMKTILYKGRNRCMHDASASEPMITVRPARLFVEQPLTLSLSSKGRGQLINSPPLTGRKRLVPRGDEGEGEVKRALKAANRTLLQDRFAEGQQAVKRPGKCVQLLVVYYQRQQSEQRVERELQQWQRQQQQ